MMSPVAEDGTKRVQVTEPLVASRRDKRGVLYHKRKIDDNLQAALVSIAKGDINHAWQLVLAAQQDVQGIGNFLNTIIEPELYDEEKVVRGRIAEKFFAIPELLEATLLELSLEDIMGCYRVGRSFRDGIEGSPKLQRHLYLQPAVEATDDDQAFPIQTKSFVTHTEGETCYVDMRCPRRLPIIGLRWRRMFLMQPAAHNIYYWVRCRASKKGCSVDRSRKGLTYMESYDGVTIGDLLDKAEELQSLHRECERIDFAVHFQIVKSKNDSSEDVF